MSGEEGKGNGRLAAPAASLPIPVAARKLVQSLKEIVHCSDAEIYATLKDCNMDPDETVNRLLTQDTFHEVKSKRDKKKEIKETPETRTCPSANTSNRGARGSADRGGHISTVQPSPSDHHCSGVKSSSTKENETNSNHTSSILGPNPNQKLIILSSASSKNVMPSANTPDGTLRGYQHNWSGMPGHMSMADVVKMGRPQTKPSSSPAAAAETAYTAESYVTSSIRNHNSKQPISAGLPPELEQGMPTSQGPLSQVTDSSHETVLANDRHMYNNDWSVVDEPSATRALTMPQSPASVYAGSSESSALLVDAVNLHGNHHLGKTGYMEGDVNSRDLSGKSIEPFCALDRQVEVERNDSEMNDGLSVNINTYHSQGHSFELHEAATSFQQQRMHNEELVVTKTAEDNPAVIIPNHLQVTNTDCAHLSFGSFGFGAFSEILPAKSLKNNLEVEQVAVFSSGDQSDVRNHKDYSIGPLKPSPKENVARISSSEDNLDMQSVPQPEVLRTDKLDTTHGLQYNIPSVSGHVSSNTTQSNALEYAFPQGNTQLENLSAFSNLPQANSLQSNLMAPTIPPLRDFDFSNSLLLMNQSMPTRYSLSMPSTSGTTISMEEAVKSGVFSNPQTAQCLQSSDIPAGPLPQHLPVHPYSQPALPLGFTSLIGYQFLPQNYTYLPSGPFQQPYSSNSLFHQSAAAVPDAGIKYPLPQYKSSATSLPQASPIASGYGGFGSSDNLPVSFALNPSTTTASTSLGFGETLGSQYKEHMSLQQSENPATWLHGAGSRTLSTLPASTLYGYHGQSQQSGFRQVQQPSQFGASGYPDIYHSQAGVASEHKQNPNVSNLSGSQSTASQPSHQIWQHSY